MSKEQMLVTAIGALVGVIGILFRFLLKLDQRLQAKNDQMIQFAKDIMSKGDACEVLEKVARILREAERKESPNRMGGNDYSTGSGDS